MWNCKVSIAIAHQNGGFTRSVHEGASVAQWRLGVKCHVFPELCMHRIAWLSSGAPTARLAVGENDLVRGREQFTLVGKSDLPCCFLCPSGAKLKSRTWDTLCIYVFMYICIDQNIYIYIYIYINIQWNAQSAKSTIYVDGKWEEMKTSHWILKVVASSGVRPKWSKSILLSINFKQKKSHFHFGGWSPRFLHWLGITDRV